MRFWILLTFGLLTVFTPSIGVSGDKQYEKGKLVDMQRYGTGSGALRAQGAFCFAVQVGDLTYLARREAYWRWSYEPTDFVVGDSVDVKIKGKDLYLRRPKSGDLKTSITRRERNDAGKPPADCSLAVSVRN
jgi:hypothetical protein